LASLPLERLVDLAASRAPDSIPAELVRLYGGPLELPSPRLYANFVSSIDGVVALGAERNSGSLISGKNPADRFVMGLLRALADAVFVGAGTMRAEGKGALWTPDYIYPAAAGAFADLRQRLGLSPQPQLAILTASGEIFAAERALEAGALILTTESAAAGLKARLPAASRVVVVERGRGFSVADAVQALRAEGFQRLLSEGGPTVAGELLGAGLLDELFLTVSPLLAGRTDGTLRRGLAHGREFPAKELLGADLVSLRRSESYLFLRYRLKH
jgi:riboflavin biosynthesis pyrimidine reductase